MQSTKVPQQFEIKERLPELLFKSVILVFVMICFVNIVSGETDDVLSLRTSQGYNIYSSTDIPKDVWAQQTTSSVLQIQDKGIITDIDVQIKIWHPSCPYLGVSLMSPDGTVIDLLYNITGASSGFNDTVLDDEADKSITEGTGGCTGIFKPISPLNNFNGKNSTGTWTLLVQNKHNSRNGKIYSWHLMINQKIPSPVIQSTASNSGGICDTLSWDDVGPLKRYEFENQENIPANGTLNASQVIDDYYEIEDVNVMVNINHSHDSELNAALISPDDTRVSLFEGVGGSSANFKNTILDDEATISIANGSAPFEGVYKPKGKLSSFIGKNIFGPWTLEINDDTNGTSGVLKSWSLVTNLADIAYYTECALDSKFNQIVANSGWDIDKAITFDDLDPNNNYFYRTKARLLSVWSESTSMDFKSDTLSNTIVTNTGDVVISPEANMQQVNAIADPSFEVLKDDWYVTTTNPLIFLASASKNDWVSDGDHSIAMIFDYYYGLYFPGDFFLLSQSVNWTNVDRLKFDFCCQAFNFVSARVYIGGKSVWSHTPGDTEMHELLDQTIDTSNIKGVQDLMIQVSYNAGSIGYFDSIFFWDNFRTYKKAEINSEISGTIISKPVTINKDDTWDKMFFSADIPIGANLILDILPEDSAEPIKGYANISSETDLSGLEQRTIRLRANMLTKNISNSPVLHNWVIFYASSSGESDWSNTATSDCSN